MNVMDHLGGHAAHHRIGRNIPRHHRACGHHGAVANGHPGQHGGVGADPDPFSDMNGSREHVAAPLRLHGVVQSGQHHIVANQDAVADENAPLILKLAAHVDKDMLADVDVLTAVRVEGREQREALIHWLAGQPGEQDAQLLRRMVAAVDLRREAQRLLTGPVHEQMRLAPVLYGFSAVQILEKCV